MIDLDVNLCLTSFGRWQSSGLGQRSIIGKYSPAHNYYMATARAFKLSKDINLNLGNKNINIIKGYARATDLESKIKTLNFRKPHKYHSNFFNPLEGSRVTCF